jgi:arabinoxylan arabinofuranohydrolase
LREHRGSQQFRRLCIEPIAFDGQGLIAEVPMTSQGAGQPFGLGEPIEAWRACELHGGAWIGPDAQGQELLQNLSAGDRAIWRWLQLDAPATRLSVLAHGSGEVELRRDGDTAIGSFSVRDGQLVLAHVYLPPGRHELRLRVVQSEALRLVSLTLLMG